MTISERDWSNYIRKLRKLSDTVADKVKAYIERHGLENTKELIDYSYALVSQYGEGAAALSAQMYDILAELEGRYLEPAEMAPTATYGEVAKSVNGTLKTSNNPNEISGAVSRWVKMAGSDTTLKNAERDGAQFAWIPSGDTCAFCLTLASRGWQYMSKNALKHGHAEHIHSHCDCQYAVRFDSKSTVAGYDPDKYRQMYENAEGDTPQEKINSMRRAQYEENKDEINAKKRAAYAEQKGMSVAAGTLPKNMKRYVPDPETRKKIIKEGIEREKPIFCKDDPLLSRLANNLPDAEGFYTVVAHGENGYSCYFDGEVIDADTLCAIIAQRKDYKKGTDIRLIICYSGSEDDGLAKYVSDKLKVTVIAPDKLGIINKDVYGRFSVYSGSAKGVHDGEMRTFEFTKEKESR